MKYTLGTYLHNKQAHENVLSYGYTYMKKKYEKKEFQGCNSVTM